MRLKPKARAFHYSLGRRGENAASDFLMRRGYEILEKNYSERAGEIDLIAKKGERIIFAEVKTRRSSRFGTPEEAANFKKQRKIIRLAARYLSIKGLTENPVSFDVLAVDWPAGREPEIRHYENAFDAGDGL